MAPPEVIANPKADWIGDVLEYETYQRFKLAICYGSLNFYDYEWIRKRFEKVLALTLTSGIIMMKVNPGFPHVDGTMLPWYDKWTTSLALHYGQVFNLKTTNIREAANGRFKFDYLKND